MTLMLLNAQALCNLHMGKFEEAERMLQESLSKNANGRSRPTSTGHAHGFPGVSPPAHLCCLQM